MTTEELIIDGQAVDLGSGTAVTLNFTSNLLGDISGIQSSYSQTVRLPKTARNSSVLDSPTAPAYRSSFRRTRHTACYRRNGVEVVHDGVAVLLDCSDGYEIALYWGIKSRLQSWLDEGGSLSDLGWEPAVGGTAWQSQVFTRISVLENAADSPYEGFVWAGYDCGIDSEWFGTAGIFLHPFVSAHTLLKRIADRAGVTVWNVPDDLRRELSLTAVLLSTRNISAAREYAATSARSGLRLSFEENSFFSVSGEASDPATVITVNYSGTARVRIQGEFEALWSAFSLTVQRNGTAVARSDLLWTAREEYGGGLETADIWRYKYTYQADVDVPFSCEAGDEIRIVSGGFFLTEYLPDPGIVRFTPPADKSPIDLGDEFPASENMPDITQLDFLKALCAMYGMYVMPYGTDGLQFCTLEALTDNRDNAVDWSDRLAWSGTDGEPGETRFSIGDYARHNLFRYKEDEKVETDGDGDMEVFDERLEDERTVITLPFSASDSTELGGTACCRIPHYKWDGDDPADWKDGDGDEPEYKAAEESVSPRIVRMAAASGLCVAQFTPLRFPSLLRYRSTLNAMLNEAVVIVEDFRLSEFDLLGLDFLRPVYLRQYGRYYGIVSVRTKDGGLCEAELMQLPIPEAQ